MNRKGKWIAALVDGGLMSFLVWFWIRCYLSKDELMRPAFAEAMALSRSASAWVYILVSATRAATSMTLERESGNWESLLSTRLTGAGIVVGKTLRRGPLATHPAAARHRVLCDGGDVLSFRHALARLADVPGDPRCQLRRLGDRRPAVDPGGQLVAGRTFDALVVQHFRRALSDSAGVVVVAASQRPARSPHLVVVPRIAFLGGALPTALEAIIGDFASTTAATGPGSAFRF